MASFNNLPPEVLLKIFYNLPVRDIRNAIQTCKALNDILNSDVFWEKKIQYDFKLDLKKDEEVRLSFKDFYLKILHPYGQLIGIWQVSSYGDYGGIFQVSIQFKFIIYNIHGE